MTSRADLPLRPEHRENRPLLAALHDIFSAAEHAERAFDRARGHVLAGGTDADAARIERGLSVAGEALDLLRLMGDRLEQMGRHVKEASGGIVSD